MIGSFLAGIGITLVILITTSLLIGWRKLTKKRRRWKSQKSLHLQAHEQYLDGIPSANEKEKSSLPNVVVILMDDMGWGDIGAFGNSVIKTPNLDALAASGAVMRNGFASSPVCTPSRFGLLTGRYPHRGLIDGVFFPSIKAEKSDMFDMGYDNDGAVTGRTKAPKKKGAPTKLIHLLMRKTLPVNGILEDEITLPEALKARGYKTGMFGKWHLGDISPHLPNDKGFDYFYGAHYSNDMIPYRLWRNREVDQDSIVDQSTLTSKLTDEILSFIDKSEDDPFFVYYPSPWPHHPLNAGTDFQGTSDAGRYGDCIQEVDWSVGRIMEKLQEKGVLENTLVIFTSDNGPWHQGSPGGHRGRKGNAFNGGVAVPTIFSWPTVIPEKTVSDEQVMNIDYMPTILGAAGIPLPEDREIDGHDILPLLRGDVSESPDEELFYVYGMAAFALSNRDHYKYYASNKSENSTYGGFMKIHPFLFNTSIDIDESYDLRPHEPEKANTMRNRLAEFNRNILRNPRGWK